MRHALLLALLPTLAFAQPAPLAPFGIVLDAPIPEGL